MNIYQDPSSGVLLSRHDIGEGKIGYQIEVPASGFAQLTPAELLLLCHFALLVLWNRKDDLAPGAFSIIRGVLGAAPTEPKDESNLLTKIMGTLGALESQLMFFRPNPLTGALAIVRDAMKEFGKLQEGK